MNDEARTDTTDAAPAGDGRQTRGFQAEVKQLLHLMIHSLYSNPEIFLRELISNASDAADKLRFEALAHPEYYESDPDLRITVAFDKEARTITVRDNGIGMSHDEVVAHIGTIAKSGTREFFSALSGDQAKDAQLIGQFGVGFYSSFIVADRVTLLTRRAGLPASEGVGWESAGEGEYTIERIDRAQRGTEVTLHLREGQEELLSRWRLASIIRKYSDHIALPIYMRKEVWDEAAKGFKVTDDEGNHQPGVRVVGTATAGHHGGAVRRVLQACRARPVAAARARPRPDRRPHRVHAAVVRAFGRALRPVGSRPSARRQAVRAPRVHHG